MAAGRCFGMTSGLSGLSQHRWAASGAVTKKRATDHRITGGQSAHIHAGTSGTDVKFAGCTVPKVTQPSVRDTAE